MANNPPVFRMARWLTGFVLVGSLVGGMGCSKHKCKLEGKQKDYWSEIANTTGEAKLCIVSTEPYGCTPGEGRCVPTLTANHEKGDQAVLEKHYRPAFEQLGWTFVGEKVSEDKSKIMAFSKGEKDELLVAFGENAAFLEVFMMRRPENATNSMVDKYR